MLSHAPQQELLPAQPRQSGAALVVPVEVLELDAHWLEGVRRPDQQRAVEFVHLRFPRGIDVVTLGDEALLGEALQRVGCGPSRALLMTAGAVPRERPRQRAAGVARLRADVQVLPDVP